MPSRARYRAPLDVRRVCVLPVAKISSVVQEVAQSERFKSLTPRELETYNELKTSVISRLFHFWVILLEKYSDSR
jgi:hypothetical protein